MSRAAPARGRRWLLAVVAAGIVVLLGAAPAGAHADLESTSPSGGGQVASEPDSVVLTFSEAVSLPARAIIVLDARFNRVDTGDPTHPAGDAAAAAVGLRRGLPDASYLVVWHVISDDGHPVSGTFTFGIGVPASPVLAGAATSPDPLLAAVHWLAQFAALAGTLVLIGAVVLLLFVWPAGASSGAARRVVSGAWSAALAGTVLLLVVGGAYGEGGGAADLLSTATLSAMVATTAGRLGVLRVGALLVGAAIWRHAGRSGRLPRWLDLVGVWLFTVETFSFAGHAGHGTSPVLASTVDLLHLSGAGVWVGGVVVIASALLRRPVRVDERVPVTAGAPAELAEHRVAERPVADATGPVLMRWSRLATGSVALVAVTGGLSAGRDVGSWGALVATTYGRLVLTKVALFVVVLLVASFSHRLVRRWAGAHGSARAAALRRLVLTESAVAVGILAVTAALVSTTPGVETYLPSFTTTLTGQAPSGARVVLDVLVRPTRPGFEGLTIHAASESGAAVPITTANLRFVNRENGIGPIDFPATTTAGRGVEDTIISVPGPGRWDVSMRLLIDERWYSASSSYDVG